MDWVINDHISPTKDGTGSFPFIVVVIEAAAPFVTKIIPMGHGFHANSTTVNKF